MNENFKSLCFDLETTWNYLCTKCVQVDLIYLLKLLKATAVSYILYGIMQQLFTHFRRKHAFNAVKVCELSSQNYAVQVGITHFHF